MDLLNSEMGGGGGSRSKDAELARAMFEGTQQYRKKLKLPELNAAAEKIKDAAEDESFFAFYDEDEVGRFFFLKWVSEIQPLHGMHLLQCHRYK